jgi:tRNA uridine 5-carboxymethylaminomethyl modification enzyme
LRHDNADRRLTAIGRGAGLVDDVRWQRLTAKEAEIARALDLLRGTRAGGVTLEQMLRRPEVEWAEVASHEPRLAAVSREAAIQVACDLKYAGYIGRQEQQVARQRRLADKRIPDTFSFTAIRQLRTEAREKLSRIRPVTLAQASRISGITPADLALVLAHLEGGPSLQTGKGEGGRGRGGERAFMQISPSPPLPLTPS